MCHMHELHFAYNPQNFIYDSLREISKCKSLVNPSHTSIFYIHGVLRVPFFGSYFYIEKHCNFLLMTSDPKIETRRTQCSVLSFSLLYEYGPKSGTRSMTTINFKKVKLFWVVYKISCCWTGVSKMSRKMVTGLWLVAKQSVNKSYCSEFWDTKYG